MPCVPWCGAIVLCASLRSLLTPAPAFGLVVDSRRGFLAPLSKGRGMAQVDWGSFLWTQVWSVPLALVYCVGILLAGVFWRKHPEVSLLSVLAFLLLLVGLAASAGIQFWVMNNRGDPDVARTAGLLGGARNVLVLLAWGVLLVALFGWRHPRPTEGKPPPDQYDYSGMGPTRF